MKSILGKRAGQKGVLAVEFAIILVVLLLLVFGVMELARAAYLYNTLQEVTRRAASAAINTNFRNEPDKAKVRREAIFRTNSGTLVMGEPVSDAHIRIDYLSLIRNADGSITMTPIPDSSLPSCPARNRLICLSDPYDAACIRLVRVRVCDPADASTCTPVPYKPMLPLVELPIRMPVFTAISTAESLGFTPGEAPCP